MSILLDGTGVAEKYPGDNLSSADFNAVNNTLNKGIAAINELISEKFDIHSIDRDYQRTYTLSQAISSVPSEIRKTGICIRFRYSNDEFVEFVFTSSSMSDWDNELFWIGLNREIDGGVW